MGAFPPAFGTDPSPRSAVDCRSCNERSVQITTRNVDLRNLARSRVSEILSWACGLDLGASLPGQDRDTSHDDHVRVAEYVCPACAYAWIEASYAISGGVRVELLAFQPEREDVCSMKVFVWRRTIPTGRHGTAERRRPRESNRTVVHLTPAEAITIDTLSALPLRGLYYVGRDATPYAEWLVTLDRQRARHRQMQGQIKGPARLEEDSIHSPAQGTRRSSLRDPIGGNGRSVSPERDIAAHGAGSSSGDSPPIRPSDSSPRDEKSAAQARTSSAKTEDNAHPQRRRFRRRT